MLLNFTVSVLKRWGQLEKRLAKSYKLSYFFTVKFLEFSIEEILQTIIFFFLETLYTILCYVNSH